MGVELVVLQLNGLFQRLPSLGALGRPAAARGETINDVLLLAVLVESQRLEDRAELVTAEVGAIDDLPADRCPLRGVRVEEPQGRPDRG